jgi:hypothetical protein
VEVYVNGHLAGTASTPADFGPLRTVVDEGLNAAFCVPTTWIQNPVSKPGVTQAWHTRNASEGIAVIRATIPGSQTSVNVPKILDIGVQKFAAAFLPKLSRPSAPQHFRFMGLSDQLEQTYRYKGGFIQAGAGYDAGEGAVVVGIAFGSTARSIPVEQAFLSLSSLQQVPQG